MYFVRRHFSDFNKVNGRKRTSIFLKTVIQKALFSKENTEFQAEHNMIISGHIFVTY